MPLHSSNDTATAAAAERAPTPANWPPPRRRRREPPSPQGASATVRNGSRSRRNEEHTTNTFAAIERLLRASQRITPLPWRPEGRGSFYINRGYRGYPCPGDGLQRVPPANHRDDDFACSHRRVATDAVDLVSRPGSVLPRVDSPSRNPRPSPPNVSPQIAATSAHHRRRNGRGGDGAATPTVALRAQLALPAFMSKAVSPSRPRRSCSRGDQDEAVLFEPCSRDVVTSNTSLLCGRECPECSSLAGRLSSCQVLAISPIVVGD